LKGFLLAVALIAGLAVVAVPSASALAFDDQPCVETHPPSGILLVCPSGTVGASYSTQLAPKEGGGNGPPYTFILKAGALPAGLQLSSSGLISGVPTGAGTSTFGIELQDNPGGCAGCGCVNRNPPTCAYRDFAITIAAGLSINNQSVKPGTLGQAYSETLTASLVTSLNPLAGTPASNVTWSLSSGALPPGVVLGANGLLAGSPTTEGSYQFVVRAQRDVNQTDTETLTIVVRTPVTIAAPPTVPPSEVDVPFRMQLSASGGTGTFTWSVSSGVLPTGVGLAADGTISGTPAAGGSFGFTASATDSEGRIANYPGLLTVAPRLAISTLKIRPAKVGRLYRAKLKALGGVLPKTWRVKGRLPRGIRLDRTLGVLSGTPLKAGTYRITVEVVDALKVKSTTPLVLVVVA